VTGHWSLVTGHWSLVTGHWSLVIGHWSLVIGHWSLVTGHWSLVISNFQLVIGGSHKQGHFNLSQDGRRNSLSRTSAAQYRAIIGRLLEAAHGSIIVRLSEGMNGAIVVRLSEDKRSRIGRKRPLEAQGINDPRASWFLGGQVMPRVSTSKSIAFWWCRWRGSNPHVLTDTRF
jgi:hypothetical protein